jgi:hypothetical protein
VTATNGKRRGRGLKVLLGLLITVVVLWCAYWYAARTIAGSGINRIVASLAETGGRATCGEAAIGGFPLRLDLSCTTFALANATGNSVGFEAVRAQAPLYRPGEVNLSLAGPLALSLPREPEPIKATWSDASGQIIISLSGLSSIAATIRELHMEAAGLPPVTLGQVELSAAPSGADYRLMLTIGEGEVTMADGSPGLRIGVGADLIALDIGSSLGTDPLSRLLEWLRSGGALRIDRAAFTAGETKVAATGDLTLSEEGLLTGGVTVTLTGLDDLPDTAEMLLSETRDDVEPLVVVVKGLAREVEEGGVTSYVFPLRVRNGRVSLGFIPITTIPALAF